MGEADRLQAELQAALAAGRFPAAVALAQRLTRMAPERAWGWHLLGVALLLAGQAEQLYRRVLPVAGAGAPLLYLKDVFLDVSWRKAGDAILAAAAKAPAEPLWSLIPAYFAACVLLERGAWSQGFALLGAFRSRALANLSSLPLDDADGFGVLFRHALLTNDETFLEDPFFVQNLAANRALLGPVSWLAGAEEPEGDPGRAVLAVSCDQRYAALFLPRFLDSVETFCRGRTVHLHLLDPDPDTPTWDSLPRLQHNRLVVSWENTGALRSAAWYASARFVRMAEWLAHHGRPVVLFDVDVALCRPVDALEQALAAADFGCFRMDRLDPGSVYQASVTAFRPSPGGQALAALVGDLILAKFALQRPFLWLVDQASLFSALYILEVRAGQVRRVDFTQTLAMPIEDYVAFCGRTQEKFQLMLAASGVTPAA